MKNNLDRFDVLVVGSGPSGIQAALECTRAQVRTGLIDIGYTGRGQVPIPEKSFTEIRASELRQELFFLGKDPEAQLKSPKRAGVHLSPGRMHMVEDMEVHFPLRSESFFALQSTGLGGLGIGWGANAFALEDAELKKIGIPPEQIRKYYADVSKDIGISGRTDNAIASRVTEGLSLQPPLPLDTNAQSILKSYDKRKHMLDGQGLLLGQSVVAILSRPIGSRRANPLFDMDYWSDAGKSVYRPVYTLEDIQQTPALAHSFTYIPKRKVTSFSEDELGVRVCALNTDTGAEEVLYTKKLILAAGALGSARIVLQSFKDYTHKTPLLCNHNLWVAAINLPMLGKPAQDKRYSLAQLTSLLKIPESSKDGCNDYLLAQFYSYRSLLLHRLLRDIPLPLRLGVYFLRLVMTSLTVINIHFSDRPSQIRYLQLAKEDGKDVLVAESSFSAEEEALFAKSERVFFRILRSMKIFPLSTVRPMHGASIHYAGTLPYSQTPGRATCDERGKLHETSHVYVADSAPWKFLPSKGLTVTLMANARRTARYVIDELHHV